MSDHALLKAEQRASGNRGSVKQLRAGGETPGVLYGKGEDAVSIRVPSKELDSLLSHAAGENMLVELEVGKKNETVLMQELQRHPVTGDVLHVDFLAVAMDEKLNAEVPLETVGEAIGVKEEGGILEQMIHGLQVECLPNDLPDSIEVDISKLEIGDSMHVSEINLPSGVETTIDGEVVAFHVAAPKTAAQEEEEEADGAADEPEVINEKQDSDEEESKDEEGGE